MYLSLVLAVSAVAGGLLAVALLLFRLFRLPRFPKSRVDAFLEKAGRGPLAHRGGFPENTLAAFRQARKEGASGVEVDLTFSKDGQPVLLHDETVDRTSDGSGRVDEFTLEQLKELDVGSKYKPEFAGEKIPTLDEALDVCEELDLLLFLELKGGSAENVLRVVKKVFAERPNLSERVCVISFWPWMLYQVRRMDPSIMCGLTIRRDELQYQLNGQPKNEEFWRHVKAGLIDTVMFWSTHTWLWEVLGISLLLPYKGNILDKKIDPDLWYARGVRLVTWTVNDNTEKTHFDTVLRIPYMTDSVSRLIVERTD